MIRHESRSSQAAIQAPLPSGAMPDALPVQSEKICTTLHYFALLCSDFCGPVTYLALRKPVRPAANNLDSFPVPARADPFSHFGPVWFWFSPAQRTRRHEVVFDTAWRDSNPDQVLRVAEGSPRRRASGGRAKLRMHCGQNLHLEKTGTLTSCSSAGSMSPWHAHCASNGPAGGIMSPPAGTKGCYLQGRN
jgi:hypothetical protein